ncbi:hypothetical protein [Xenorhabdus bovienii]|uniref:hypothetical protein n=1 Tax=Xenorhabdus bovienii TaxID=40576 RepID=UPI0023B2CE96|nr:hypothetical protein [Xenorhabdus bovienii]
MSIINKPDYKIFANHAKTGELETFPDLLRGWGVTVDRTAGKPPMEWFNALGKRTDEWMMYLSQRGLSEWDAAIDYPQHAVVQHAGKFYTAKKQTNGQRPDQSQNEWMLFADAIGIAKSIADALNGKQESGDYATNSALNTVNDNANSRLEKKQNGADIPDPKQFVENLGLLGTVDQAKNAVPNSRKINGQHLTNDVILNAVDVGAVSATGGVYNGDYSFGVISTLPTEYNSVRLESAKPGASQQLMGFTSYSWYRDYILTGLLRGPSEQMDGYAVMMNGHPMLTLSRTGELKIQDRVLPGNYQNFDARYVGNIRLGEQNVIEGIVPHGGQTNTYFCPPGHVITGLSLSSNGNFSWTRDIYHRAIQRLINGKWLTVEAL